MGFKGFDQISDLKYTQDVFNCNGCGNECDVSKIKTNDQELFYGDKCEKFSGIKKSQEEIVEKNPFQRREEILMSYEKQRKKGGINIGLPRGGLFNELYPLWSTFLDELGFCVINSEKTNKKIITKGLEKTTEDFCFPFKVLFGHFSTLDDLDYMFVPDITEGFKSKYSNNGEDKSTNWERSSTCPYLHNLDALVAKNFTTKRINPRISLRAQGKKIISEFQKEFTKNGFKISEKKIKKAFNLGKNNYYEFKQINRKIGKDVLENLSDKNKGIVIIGRPYTAFDEELNLRLARRISQYGFTPIPMDFLQLPKYDLSEKWNNEFSAQGQLILNSASVIKELGLNAIFLDYFGCGPNSFIKSFFAKELEKPFLTIEIDEHTASAGLVTRLEAFLDSIQGK